MRARLFVLVFVCYSCRFYEAKKKVVFNGLSYTFITATYSVSILPSTRALSVVYTTAVVRPGVYLFDS